MGTQSDSIETIFKKEMRPEEYTSISSKINSLANMLETYIIAMHTITIAIIGFALDRGNPWLYILPYIILISFQRIIDVKKYNLLKFSAYLACFSDDIWESNYLSIEDKLFKPTYTKATIGRLRIVRISSLHLGLLCSLLSIIAVFTNNFTEFVSINAIEIRDFVLVLSSILLFIFMMYWTRDALDSSKTLKKYIKHIKEVRADIENAEEKKSE